MSQLRTIDDLIKEKPVKGLKVLVRVDFNVPMQHGKITDKTRIEKIIPTVKTLINNGAKVILISHFGRPKGYSIDLSLAPIADALNETIENTEVKFGIDCIGSSAEQAVAALKDGEVILLENLRFHPGEEKNDPEFAGKLASLGEIYINDAFSCSHRAHASITGIAEILPSYAGYLFRDELEHLQLVLEKPDRPVAAIVGGSKVSTKIKLLGSLVTKMDYLIIGGGMANTFLYAQGKKIGKSLFEKDFRKTATNIIEKAGDSGCRILLPVDAVSAAEIKHGTECLISSVDEIPGNMMILDIGPRTMVEWVGALSKCKTVLWNGPLGVFEQSPFDAGTVSIAHIIAELTHEKKLRSVAGGGDVISAVSHSGVRNSFSYISTAGGAFLEWLEGNELPGIKALHG